MVITTPKTAATIPSPGSASATVDNAPTGTDSSWWWTSMSISIIWSRSNAGTPPEIDMRSVPHTNATMM